MYEIPRYEEATSIK